MELQGHWARYLCVLACGFLEVSFKAVLVEVANRRGSSELSNFTEASLDRVRSPNMETIQSILAAFSKEWSDSYELKTEGQLKDSVNSLVGNRHLIAHGKDSGVSIVRVKNWYKDSIKAVRELEGIVGIN